MKARLLLAAALGLQAFTALGELPPARIGDPAPLWFGDFPQIHYYAVRAADFFGATGRLWGYDPTFLAGFPDPVLTDDSKLLPLLYLALGFLGRVLVLKGTVLAAALLPPLAIWAAARLFRFRPGTAAGLALFTALCWLPDPFLGFFRNIGMFTWLLAAFLAPVVAGLLLRLLEEGGRRWTALWLLAAPLFGVHYLAVFAMGPPLLVVLWVRRAALRERWPALAVQAALVGLLHAAWALPILEHLGDVTDPGFYWPGGGAGRLVAELFGWRLWSFGSPEQATLTLRNLALWGAAGGLWLLRRSGRRREALLLGAPAAFCLLVTYGGSALEVTRVLQPYRFAAPLVAWTLLACGGLIEEGRAALRGAPGTARRLAPGGVVLALALLSNVGPDVRAFWRWRPLRARPDEADRALVRWLSKETDRSARILFESRLRAAYPALLPLEVDRQLIGGPYPHPFVRHGYANFDFDRQELFGRRYADWTGPDLARALEAYNVGWVVIYEARLGSRAAEMLQRARAEGVRALVRIGNKYVAFRVERRGSWFAQGAGSLEAAPGRIALRGLTAGETVIRYHFHPRLRARPEVPLERAPVLDDPVGFVRLRNGAVRDLELVLE